MFLDVPSNHLDLCGWETVHALISKVIEECELGNEKRPAAWILDLLEHVYPNLMWNEQLKAVNHQTLCADNALLEECPAEAARYMRLARRAWDAYGLSLGSLK